MVAVPTQERSFDLNIERILEHWTIAHALREIIANALDEQALSGTEDAQIYKDDEGTLHIRDFGRGLRYEHLTQNENKEKLAHPEQVVGKFGVGLKDALATLDRHHIKVTIRSPHGDLKTRKQQKHGFADVKTLHAMITEPMEPAQRGTDFVLDGVKDKDVDRAKGFFLRYSDEELLEETAYGGVLKRGKHAARIYVGGLHVADEENFLFSYNITSLTSALRKALNRERTNVGRSAYTERVKAILLACESPSVADSLADDLSGYETGAMHDELQWMEVGLHACRILNAHQKVIFVTTWDLSQAASFIARAEDDGYRVVIVPENISYKLGKMVDISGEPMRDLKRYREEWSESFEFSFVSLEKLTEEEMAVWKKSKAIFRLAGGKPRMVREVKVSETMRLESHSYREAVGVWDLQHQCIVIKRDQLKTVPRFAGTLLHELAHAKSAADDITEEFEDALTGLLGRIVSRHFEELARERS
jgi:hypothetical protein